MKSLLMRYATPFITGLFIVSLISGIGLFLHLGPAGFRGMHEWLSMLLILPFGLHLWKNWRAMLAYFKRSPMAIALALSLAAALPFLIPTTGDRADGPPQFQLAHRLLGQPAPAVAAALGIPEAALTTALTQAGIPLAPADQPLSQAATAAGKSETILAEVLLGLGK